MKPELFAGVAAVAVMALAPKALILVLPLVIVAVCRS